MDKLNRIPIKCTHIPIGEQVSIQVTRPRIITTTNSFFCGSFCVSFDCESDLWMCYMCLIIRKLHFAQFAGNILEWLLQNNHRKIAHSPPNLPPRFHPCPRCFARNFLWERFIGFSSRQILITSFFIIWKLFVHKLHVSSQNVSFHRFCSGYTVAHMPRAQQIHKYTEYCERMTRIWPVSTECIHSKPRWWI